jgi:ribosomal protein L12E/L44/L45/RPP1/RPP2
MNGAIIGVVALRAAALALAIAGDTVSAAKLHLVADAIEAGKATDEHMKLVADKLKERDVTQADWDDVLTRIESDHARLQGS